MIARVNICAIVLALGCVWSVSSMAAEQKAAPSASQGKALYQARCGACHLEGGGGTIMLSKRLGKEKSILEERKDLLPLYTRTVVRHGIGSMPWFTRTELPDSELAAIAEYLTPAGSAR